MSTEKKDYSYLDKIALQPEKWENLSTQEFQLMTFRHCMFYGISQNKKMIPQLFHLYDSLMKKTSLENRIQMLTGLSSAIRKNQPKAIMGLMPFINVEEEGEIIRTASCFFVNLSVLTNKEFQSGANILLQLIENNPEDRRNAYILLGLLDTHQDKIEQMLLPLKTKLNAEIKSILWNNGVDFL
jgi:hypothetical protein